MQREFSGDARRIFRGLTRWSHPPTRAAAEHRVRQMLTVTLDGYVRRTVWRLLATLALVCSAVGIAHAQTIRLELRDSTTGEPVIGALVSASDSLGTPRVDGLSNDRGVVTLRLPEPGIWSLRIRRIGLAPRRLDGVRVDAGATVTIPLIVTSTRQLLSRIRVNAESGICGRSPDGENRTAMLWEQISLALRASTLSRTETGTLPALRIQERVRELTPSLVEVSSTVTSDGYGTGRPYSAASPDSLASVGYIRQEGLDDYTYFAPDEVVLLSEAFISTHCFDTPKQDQDPTLAELKFRPVRGRSVADVEGTAFVDTLSGELRRIEFHYVAPGGAMLPGRARHAGGDVVLRRFANGQWIVSRWAIRMPLYTLRGTPIIRSLRGYREVGGTVDLIEEVPP